MFSMNQGWTLTLLSTLLCISGCSIIFTDVIYKTLFPSWSRVHPFKLTESYSVLIASLSLSSGCLIFTSLYRLLPESLKYLKLSDETASSSYTNAVLMVCFLLGMVLCSSFNAVLHVLTSESVVHCQHGGEEGDEHSVKEPDVHGHEMMEAEHTHGHGHGHEHHHSAVSSGHSHSHDLHSHDAHSHEVHTHGLHNLGHGESSSETTPLMHPRMDHKKSIVDITLTRLTHDENLVGECKGYSSAEACLLPTPADLHFCELPFESIHESVTASVSNQTETHHHHHNDQNPEEDHHHHVTTPLSRLFLIGIQTTLAITLHKFPEGFITYITSETNRKLGLNIFLSLAIHNFVEGFSMCLPLYYSLNSRFKALLIVGGLGGLSQPLGAFLGFLFINYEDNKAGRDDYLDHLNYIFGISLALTAGFLTIISLQMFASSISFGGSQRFVIFWCVLGICVIGASSILTSK